MASTGNLGPNCSTVQNPPAIYEATFSTGAVSGTNALAGFSSRGPVTVDGSNRIKPNIVAPGVNVRSSVNGGDTAYSIYSGTSMASPHMVGVVALLWSARPGLVRNIAATKQVLSESANPNVTVSNGGQCDGVDHVPNNHFGWGLVDALAAVNAVPPPSASATPTATPTSAATPASSPAAGATTASTATAACSSAGSATTTALPRAEGHRHEARPGEADAATRPVRNRPHSPGPLATSQPGARDCPKTRAGPDPAARLPGESRARPAALAQNSAEVHVRRPVRSAIGSKPATKRSFASLA